MLIFASLLPVQLTLLWQMAAAAALSFCTTLLLTPLARWCAHKTDVVDRPDGARKLQRQPVALLGGVAVLAGLGTTVFVAAAAGAMDNSLEAIVLVSVGLSVLCAVGVIDDAYNVRAGWKLLAQVGAAIPMVMAGCAIGKISLFGMHLSLGPFGFAAAVLWLVACTNAVNLIDGMDGLCATLGLCVAAGVTAVSWLAGADNSVVCAAALAGALAGFLIFNLPPAKIYLGDAGSMTVGMTMALLTLRVSQTQAGVTRPLIMIALMAVPLSDVALALIRRKLTGKHLFHPDRGHLHHRLLDHGWSVPRVLVVVACMALATAGIAAGVLVAGSDALGLLALASVTTLSVSLRLIGHYEWLLVRKAVAGEVSSGDPLIPADATTVLRFDLEAAARRGQIPQETAPEKQAASIEHRRAA